MIMKKGQAAMEFMMTYGWAILVVLAAIGALAAFGVFDMGSMMPDKTTFPAPFINTETGTARDTAPLDDNNITVVIPFTNGMTKSIYIRDVSVATGGGCDSVGLINVTQADKSEIYDSSQRIPTNAAFLLHFWCDTSASGLSPGDQVKMSDLTFEYVTPTSINYPHSGSSSLTIATN